MTRISTLILLCTALHGLYAFAAAPQYSTDFSGGIPQEIILIDGDMNTPATAMATIGFEAGVPWIGYYLDDEDEHVACSTSWYKPVGTSDDWMILPAISVVEGATLRWRAKSSDKKYFDGYAVYVSTDGSDRDAFNTDNPIFAVAEENNQWQSYEIPLDEFVGKDINIAFVNNSTNKAKLYIDDIKAGTDYPIIITLDIPGLVKDEAEGCDVTISGTLYTELTSPSELGDVTIHFGEETIFIANSEISKEGAKFTFPTAQHIGAGEKLEIEISCTSSTGYTYSMNQNVWSTFRQTMVEEFTGTWCSWCIRGIVYMELLKEKYGEKIIPLCVHETDVMEVPEYFSTVDYLKEESIPNAIVNRKYECDPMMLESWCEKVWEEDEIIATFTRLEIDYDSEKTALGISADVAFAESINDGAFAVSYVLVEDNVYVPDDSRYCQKNAYSGGAAGPMGGYEDLPPIIPSYDMVYHDVVRYVSTGGTHGIPHSLPGAVKAGKEYTTEYVITMPDNILNTANLSLTAMILDTKTHEVLNARSIALNDYLPTEEGISDIRISTTADVDVFTVSGIYMGSYPSVDAFMSQSQNKGLYLLRHADGTAEKILIL